MHFDLANVKYAQSFVDMTKAATLATESIIKFSACLQTEIGQMNRREARTQSLIDSTDRRQRARGYRRALAPAIDLCNAAKMWRGARDAV